MINEIDFTYCPHCGNKIVRQDDHLSCPNCALQHYINPRPTNGVLLHNDKGELLLVKRKYDPKKGLWDLPGGFIDINETVENSVHREIQEELNIEISDVLYVSSFYDRYEFGMVNAYTVCLLFEAKMKNPEKLTPTDDVEDFEFFPADKLPYDQFAFPPMRDALLRLYKRSMP